MKLKNEILDEYTITHSKSPFLTRS